MALIASSTAQLLQQLILSGRYAIGSALPAQRELAHQLGISRTSLREALSKLQTLGLVEIVPGKGTLVRAWQPRTLQCLPQASHPAVLEALSTPHLMELRLVLEPGWTALATRQADARALRQLQALQLQFAHALTEHNWASAMQADVDFHVLMAQLSGNPVLHTMAEQLQHAIAHSLRSPLVWSDAHTSPAQEHAAIVNAMCAGDAEAAASAMHDHLLQAARRCGAQLPTTALQRSSAHAPQAQPTAPPTFAFSPVIPLEGALK